MVTNQPNLENSSLSLLNVKLAIRTSPTGWRDDLRLRAPAVLPEDLGAVCSTHVVDKNFNSSSSGSTPSQRHACRRNTDSHKINKPFKKRKTNHCGYINTSHHENSEHRIYNKQVPYGREGNAHGESWGAGNLWHHYLLLPLLAAHWNTNGISAVSLGNLLC